MTAPVIGFAGLTHLGVNSAAAAAERGFTTVCYGDDPGTVARLAAGEAPVVEPGLPELLAQNRGHLSFDTDISRLANCDVVYIATDVPTDDSGRSDLDGIRALIDKVAGVLGPDAVLVVLSQVPPGFTRALDVAPGRLFYQVETLIFGLAVESALNPERYIVGCADPALPLPSAYAAVLEAFQCPVLPMNYESAELAKISINCCLVASISVANTLAEICESIGADWADIAQSLRLDQRIGEHAYLSPGLGLAGGNLERDLATLSSLTASIGADTSLIDAWSHGSDHRKGWPITILNAEILSAKPDAVVSVLGLAYKENTDSTKNSPALALVEGLAGRRVRVYDPVVPATAAPGAEGAEDALAAAKGADAVAIMTPWAEFRSLDPAELASAMSGRVLLDPWRVLDGRAAAAAGLDYFTLGVPPLRADKDEGDA